MSKGKIKVFRFSEGGPTNPRNRVSCISKDGRNGLEASSREEARYHIREDMRKRGIKAVFE